MQDVLNSVFSSIDAIVYRCENDSEFTITDICGAVTSILGYKPEEVLNNASVSLSALTHPEDEERLAEAVKAAIATGKSWDIAYRLRHANGKYTWLRTRGAAKYAAGNVTYLEGMIVGAQAEMELRAEIEDMLDASQYENQQILTLTEKVTASQRQLTMLSINARIEAARSGEMGKGFGVVADAINELAKQNGLWLGQVSNLLRQNQSTSRSA